MIRIGGIANGKSINTAELMPTPEIKPGHGNEIWIVRFAV